MKGKARFEDDDLVVVAGRRHGEIVLAILTGAVLAPLVGATIFAASDMDGPTLALAGGMACFAAWVLAGTLWRLRDGGPVFRADREGFRVHPSLSPSPIPWPDVQSIAIDQGGPRQPAVVRFRLKRRLWSFNYPLGTRRLRLGLPYMGLSHRDAAHLLRQLRRLRGATVIADRRLRSPDPDTAD